MGVVRDQRRSGRGPGRSQHHAVAAEPAGTTQDLLCIRGEASPVEAGNGRVSTFHQPRPQAVPVRPVAKRQQPGPNEPVHVRAGQSPDGKDVIDGPRLSLQAQHAEFMRQFPCPILVMIDSVDESLHPLESSGVHGGTDPVARTRIVDRPQPPVDVDRKRTDHLGESASSQHPRHGNLAEAKMRMDETECEGSISIGVRFDEGNLVLVPVDRDRRFDGKAVRGKPGKPVLRGCGLRQRGKERAAGSGGRSEQEPDGTENAKPHWRISLIMRM